ncbi:hypothetical protein CEXT_150871 [Caerostris extrusa]|uniref:Uncharacterized protein n=1 Tax=Caerostris extrusa TaxID=172846 RepID=A0AAV4NSQ4_CAEEX|nr:hypothetical protein CEXT_150871 [Caerostris extrusa]
MTLRISLALKRKQIVDLVLELQKFIENYQVKPNLANASELILEAQKMHQKIEDVLSFSIFLAYVLVFVNFLNLVSVNTMTTTSPSIQFRAVACTLISFGPHPVSSS